MVAGPVHAAPKAQLVEAHWQIHDDQSTQRIDHAAWDQFIKTYAVVGSEDIVRIRYGAVTPTDKAQLVAYLSSLQSIVVTNLNRGEQLAYWINLYNATTVNLAIDHYPFKSIRDVMSGGWFSPGPWDQDLLEVEERVLSLNHIEHGILRPIWQDARLHYALNCVSIGCPDIARQAYTRDNADQLMDDSARHYINHPRGVFVADGKLTASKIYKWYAADFGGNDKAIIAHLRQYADPALGAALASITRISDYDYVWDLNDAR